MTTKEERDKKFMKAMNNGLVLFFISQSGAGKGTVIASLIRIIESMHADSADKQYLHSITSDLLNEVIKDMPDLIEKKNNGYLLPPAIANKALFDHYEREYSKGPVCVDGSPRTLDAAEAMIEYYHEQKGKDIAVFYLELSDEEAEKRMIQRNDKAIANGEQPRVDMSTPERRQNKLSYFRKEVYPCIPYLHKFDFVTLHIIDASKPADVVLENVIERLATYHYV
jgi:adenylate kinase family enzyme